MTGDATLRSIYSAVDETIADLARLQATTQATQAARRARLDGVVARLNDSSVGQGDEGVVPERRERGEDRRQASADPEPFVALPQRTTRGGDFGPAVRAKLTREALAKRLW